MKQETAEGIADGQSESELVWRVIAKDGAAFKTMMERHNRRLYRIARSILSDDSEAEDIVQSTYLTAYVRLRKFRGDASLATCLTRITMNKALERLRRGRNIQLESLHFEHSAQIISFPQMSDDPERITAQRQIIRLVEEAFDKIPMDFRLVFMARVIEGMSVEETADLLGLKPETVKTRLHRARLLLRDELERQAGPLFKDAFPFAGQRCVRVAEAVLQRLQIAN
jgi:RNA polymerase sigma-70 factor (ECF subfamily)